MKKLTFCPAAVLRARGLISATTTTSDQELSTFFHQVKHHPKPISCYVGFDPTADSLHIGNLVSLRVLQVLQHHGFQPIALVGGATGLIGDPSGRSTERNMQSTNQIRRNAQGIEACVRRLLRSNKDHTEESPTDPNTTTHVPIIVNNLDWYLNQTPLDFIRDVGRHFRMGSMLSRDSVKSRLDSDSGMSFTEFSYQLFQAYDFLHLHQHHNCALQIGGSDQWGNILGGCELVRRVENQKKEQEEQEEEQEEQEEQEDGQEKQDPKVNQQHQHQHQLDSNNQLQPTHSNEPSNIKVQGLTVPLLTTNTGEKLGKSAGNAIWVDSKRTSPYELYQYFLNIQDEDVEQVYSMLAVDPTYDAETALSDIQQVMQVHGQAPHKRHAQRSLADAMVSWIHGEEGLESAQQATKTLFATQATMHATEGMGDIDWRVALKEAPSLKVLKNQLVGATILDVVTEELNLFKSRGETKRMIKSGGLYMNQERVENGEHVLTLKDLIDENLLIFRIGRKKYMLVDVV